MPNLFFKTVRFYNVQCSISDQKTLKLRSVISLNKMRGKMIDGLTTVISGDRYFNLKNRGFNPFF